MPWHQGTPASDLGIDWRGADDAAQADPGLCWAALTGFGTYRPADTQGLRQVLLELAPGASGPGLLAAIAQADRDAAAQQQGPWLRLAPATVLRLQAWATPAVDRFVVGWMRLDGFAASPLAPWVHRYRVALVAADESLPLPPPPPALADSGDNGDGDADGRCAAIDATRSEPVIGIIDFGCAFAHPSFRTTAADGSPGTRVRALWDMGRAHDGSGPWTACADFGHGREAHAPALGRLLADVQRQGLHGADAEGACYQRAGLDELLDPRRRWTHGTAVMNLAAGGLAPGGRADAASQADIVFVQLPRAAMEDLSGGWLGAHVVDAMHYLRRRAGGRQLLVNLSLGAYAGPHDGQSLLEQALDAMARHWDAVIVLAAGNARGRHLHAQAELAPGETAQLKWVLPASDATQSFLELWTSHVAASHHPAAAPLLHLRVDHPAVPAMPWLQAGGAAWYRADAQSPPVVSVLQVPGTRAGSGSLVRVSMAPTDRQAQLPRWGRTRAPSGHWTLSLHNPGDQALQVHAWIERDDPDRSPRSLRVQSLLQAPVGPFRRDDGATLTSAACGTHTLVVGSVAERGPGAAPRLAPDSSIGPARAGPRQGPDLVAPGLHLSPRGPVGLKVPANLSDARPVRVSGTSLAAPQVVRAAYRSLAAGVKGGAGTLLTHWFGGQPTPRSAASLPPLSRRDPRLGLGVLDRQGHFTPRR